MKIIMSTVFSLLLIPGLLIISGGSAGSAGLECCGVPEVAAEEVGLPTYIEAVPTIITAGSGEVHKVYVTVLDEEKRPLANVVVRASSSIPNRASVEPEELRTDENGKAVFTVKGVSYTPGSKAIITFRAGDVKDTVETVFQYL